ncbi:hypothetical protein HK102_001450, partial [Quaeritorhiza haematococci]
SENVQAAAPVVEAAASTGTPQGLRAQSADILEDSKNAITNSSVTAALLNPVDTFKSINVGSVVVAVILIATGALLVFFGHKLFKPVLFIAGFYFFSLLAFVILRGMQSNGVNFGERAGLIFLIVALVAGLLGGFLFMILWRLGLSAIGGLLGFTLAVFILSLINGGTISSGVGRSIFIAVFVIIGAIVINFVERPLLILGTAFPGSYAVFFGLDAFIRSGFNQTTLALVGGAGIYETSPVVYGMIAGFLVLGLVGTGVQWSMSKKDRYSNYRDRAYGGKA